MNQETEIAVRRAQLYAFLADAFSYPRENWLEAIPDVATIAGSLEFVDATLSLPILELEALQAAHRRTFGAAGSLCYETEYGLPHEYRQSQEMADIAGFYRAFGVQTGGVVHERPDHVAVELEFMHVMALKEAYALQMDMAEEVTICRDAQKKFLQDHLARWFTLFAQSLALNSQDETYLALASFSSRFIDADAARLGATPEQITLSEIRHTPYDPDFSCAGCRPAQQGGISPATCCP